MEWNHLKTFEAVVRHGSLSNAATALGVSQSTVSRHIALLEELASSPLLLREVPVIPTSRGEELLAAILPMVEAALEAESALTSDPEIKGSVCLSTVSEVVRWVLMPALPDFAERFPEVRLELRSTNRITSLAAGDADLALRLVRPKSGDLIARRVRTESYGLFASNKLELGEQTPWLGLTGSLADIPEQRYTNRAFADRPARFLFEDLDALGAAIQDRLGVAVIPRGLAVRLEDVREVSLEEVGGAPLGPLESRDIWLVVHRSKHKIPRVRVVIDWLVEVFDAVNKANEQRAREQRETEVKGKEDE